MTDKEAIEALTDKDVVNPYLTLEALGIAIDALKERAERKTGKWEYFNLFRTCSVCRATIGEKDDFNDWIPDKYCPNCGAKMEVDE